MLKEESQKRGTGLRMNQKSRLICESVLLVVTAVVDADISDSTFGLVGRSSLGSLAGFQLKAS